MIELCVDRPAQVAAWVSARLPFPVQFDDKVQAIGVAIGGKPVAGVVFQNYVSDALTGEPIMIECAMAADSPKWCSKGVIRAILTYPFVTIGVRRLNCYTQGRNIRTQRLLMGLGFQLEGRMLHAMTGGDDAMIYGLMRDTAQRWLK